MRALCPNCGFHHEVVRILDDKSGENHREMYQVAPNGECTTTWLSDKDIFEARSRFEQDAILGDEDDDV